MLKHRLLVGIPMAAAALGLFFVDPGVFFPGLFLLATLVGVLATRELLRLFPSSARPSAPVAITGVLVLLASNWYDVLLGIRFATDPRSGWPAGLTTLVVMMVFAANREVIDYRSDGASSTRLANTLLVFIYLGLLPSFLIRLRWMAPGLSPWAVLACIFVPKVGDIGAYFGGRLFGRHRMAPTLSPKKTWEGFASGLAAAACTAVGVSVVAPGLFRHGPPEAAIFGLVVGAVGVLGDLVESMFKRDALVKDASTSIPGFGGVLDVIDSVLFAAPVAYLWIAMRP